MKLEATIFNNYQLVLDEFDIPVAVRVDGEDKYRLYDNILVTGDSQGFICPGIHHEGLGRIVEFRRDNTDHFFGVLMDHGEFGYIKASRIEKVL